MKIKDLFKALIFLFVVCAVLLISDLENRSKSQKPKEIYKLAIFKINSNLVLDNVERGIMNIINKSELYKNKKIEIMRYNPEGDMPTANTIALEIINSKFDMVITISTPALQVMANANKKGIVKHVFCAVTDPFTAGVDINGPHGHQRPEYMTGIGSFQPVEKAFRIAKQANPELKRVGVVWCTGQTCSEACVKVARTICEELDIELIEMGVESVTQVKETTQSIVARGVDALWIGGDNVVEVAIDMYIHVATRAKIPVFTNNPNNAQKNSLFSVGANYFMVGEIAAEIALEILNGAPPSKFQVTNEVPELLHCNESVFNKYSNIWTLTDEIRKEAAEIVFTEF
ncbi:ABC transporter substrate-binding protein [Bacteroidota bacterium]